MFLIQYNARVKRTARVTSRISSRAQGWACLEIMIPLSKKISKQCMEDKK